MEFQQKKSITSAVTNQHTDHMKAMTAAKNEKSEAEAYIMSLVKKNEIKVTLSDVTLKHTAADVDAPLSIKIILQRASFANKEKILELASEMHRRSSYHQYHLRGDWCGTVNV